MFTPIVARSDKFDIQLMREREGNNYHIQCVWFLLYN